jgi:formylglycine-generating enzyme required for sulfatase activity
MKNSLFLVSLLIMAGSAWALKDCPECPDMVEIPAGNFMMGSPPEKVVEENEKPQHLVNIKSFSIGKYEVTQEEWFAVMGNNPSSNKGRTLPVENISWDDAQLFVQKLSQKTGKKYRLPFEAEWEYAVRAGTTTQYFWGDNIKESNNYVGNSSKQTHPVGLNKPNQFGLYDMVGNVWEWTQDCWNQNYSGAPTDGSAWTSGDCSLRVLRGGSWGYFPLNLHTSYRSRYYAVGRINLIGLRVAMTP